MTENVFIAGSNAGSLFGALDGYPPWATEATANRIQTHLAQSLKIQNLTLGQLMKSATGKGSALSPAEVNKLDDALKQVINDAVDLTKENKKRRKFWGEEEKEADQIRRRWGEWKSNNVIKVALFASLMKLGQSITSTFKENFNTFTKLNEAGLAVTSGFAEGTSGFAALQGLVKEAGVRYTDLSAAMMKYSNAINLIGVKKFATTISGAQQGLSSFGYSTKETADLLGAMTTAQMAHADVTALTDKERSDSLVKLGGSIFKLTMATGMARGAMLSNLESISKSTDANVLAGRIGNESALEMETFLASFKDQNIAKQILKLMSDPIKPLNATFMNLQKAGMGGFAQKFTAFTNTLGDMPADLKAQEMKSFVAANRMEFSVKKQQLALLAQAGSAEAQASLDFIVSLEQQADSTKALTEEERKLRDAQMKTNEVRSKLSTALDKLSASFQLLFAPTEGMIKGFTMLVDGINWVVTKIYDIFGPTVLSWAGALVAGTAAIVAFASGFGVVIDMFAKFKDWRGGKKGSASDGWTTSLGADGSGGKTKGGKKGKGGGLLDGLGGLDGGMLEGLAAGLKAFGTGSLLIIKGAAVLAASITIISAGIAASAYIIGWALPKLAEGFEAFTKVDGANLIKVALGVGALGVAFGVFAAGSVASSFGMGLSTIGNGFSKLFGDGSILDQLTKLSGMGDSLQVTASSMSSIATGMSTLSSALSSFTGLNTLKGIVETVNSISVVKAAAFAALSLTGIGLPSPTSPSGVSNPTSPRLTTVSSPSATPAAAGLSPPSSDSSIPSKPGIEKAADKTDINSVIAYQSSVLEQILLSTNNLVSVNKDILRASKNR
jgi:hypothetical protein